MSHAIREGARFVYGPEGDTVAHELEKLAAAYRQRHPRPFIAAAERMNEHDAFLITYAHTLQSPGEAPLRTLGRWLGTHLADTVSIVHLLPFYPWSSDDGFSVKDYRAVDPRYGSWQDVRAVGKDHRLMFDAVINHASAQGSWFEAYLQGIEPQRGWFRSEDKDSDTASVVRPRVTPLLTPFETKDGTRWLWTTFGPDQVDLDYRDPSLLLEIADVLLFYAEQGADVLRMDAVTYLWKELGTPSVHHPKTHGVLRLLRAFLEAAAPWMVVLTETNVPHAENLSYFGSGHDEAQMVYNFALPPLVLHSFLQQDTQALHAWAASLETPSEETWFLNFLASHDGIGVRPVEALLPREAIDAMVAHTLRRGGGVGMKRESDGSETPYELNINYLDALADPDLPPDDPRNVARFAAAHAVMMALPGVPAIYIHSLLGSEGSPELVAETGMARSINRATLDAASVEEELQDPTSRRAQVLHALQALLRARRHPSFHPNAAFEVLPTTNGVFGVRRGNEVPVYALHNLTNQTQQIDLLVAGRDLLTGAVHQAATAELPPFSVLWLEAASTPDAVNREPGQSSTLQRDVVGRNDHGD